MVEAHVPGPVQRYLERLDDVRINAVIVMLRIVHELSEDLTLKRIPVTHEQSLPQRLWLALQLEDVVIRDIRIIRSKSRDVLRCECLGLLQHSRPF